MRTRMLSLIATVGFGAASPLLGQQPQSPSRVRQDADLVAMHCGGGTERSTQGRATATGAVKGRFGGTLRAGAGTRTRPDRTLEMMGLVPPSRILQLQGLKLSAVQITRLEALQKQAQPECAHHMQLAMTAQRAANQLVGATAPDLGAFAVKLKEVSAHTVDGQVAMAKAAVAARKVLTAEQLQTIKNRRQGRQQRG